MSFFFCMTPRGSPLGRILVGWSTCSHYSLSKEVLIYYCNIVWLMYILDCGKRWSMDGSLDNYTIMQVN